MHEGKCVSICHYSCKSCDEEREEIDEKCESCDGESNRYLENNLCLCTTSFFSPSSATTSLCLPCHHSCLTCSEYPFFLLLILPFLLLFHLLLFLLLFSFLPLILFIPFLSSFPSYSSSSFFPFSSTLASCTSCHTSQILSKGTCQCPPGYMNQTGICQDFFCHFTCKTCRG